MSEDTKKTAADGRFASPTGAAGPADPAADLFGQVARTVGQRGPGKRSQEFIDKTANTYGMLPGDLLAATLMHGLREHMAAGGAPGLFLEQVRAPALAKSLQCHREDAMGMLQGVARELMPYLHQKQPLAVEIDQRSIVFAAVTQSGQAVQPGQGGVDLRPADVREKPAISMQPPARSDADGRMDAPNPLKTQEE